MEPIVLLLAVIGLPLVIVAGANQSKKQRQRLAEVGSHYESSRVSGGLFARNELHISHRGVTLVMWTWSSKNSSGTIWAARSPWVMPPFKVYAEGVASSLGKSLFSTQDIVVGVDRAFDEHFMVKGTDPSLVRSAWNQACCQMMHWRFRHGRVSSDGHKLELRRGGVTRDTEEIRAGLDLLIALAESDPLALSTLRGLEGATFYGDDPPYALMPGPTQVKIGPGKGEQGTVTRATCLAGVGDEVPDPARLEALAASFSRDEKQLCLSWHGIERDGARLLAGAALLQEMTQGPKGGVFR